MDSRISNFQKSARILTIFGTLWLVVVGVDLVFGWFVEVISADTVWVGARKLAARLSPFNLKYWAELALILAPGLVMKIWANQIKAKHRNTGAQRSGNQIRSTKSEIRNQFE